MIVKNPTFAGSTAKVDFIHNIAPQWHADGYEYVKAIAIEATTAKMLGALHPSASGWVFDGFQTHTATGTVRLGICIQAVASGELVDVAIDGFVSQVNISGTGTVTTAYSTFTRGHAVRVTDTGHLLNYGATWVDLHNAYGSGTTAGVTSTAYSVVGVAMSSGQTAVVDLYFHKKWTYACGAS